MSQQNVTEKTQSAEQDAISKKEPTQAPAQGELKEGELDKVAGGGSLNIGGKNGITIKW